MGRQRVILLVDDEQCSRDLVCAELEEAGFEVAIARGGDEAWEALSSRRFDLVVTDLRMPQSDGMTLLRRIRSPASPQPQVPVILVSAYGTLSTAVDAGRSGATDFYPLNDQGIGALIDRARRILSAEEPDLPEALLGDSGAVAELRTRIAAVAPLQAPVLIRGAEGTGHDAVALYLHQLSSAAGHPFLHVPCGEARQLGPTRQPGSLYLARVERLAPSAQRELLRELRGRELDGSEARLRVVASTQSDLWLAAEEGNFEPELADRLHRFSIQLPELSDRLQDLPALLDACLERIGRRLGRQITRVSAAAIERLGRHPWSRNLEELETAVELLIAFARDGKISQHQVEAVLAEMGSPLKRISERRLRDERRLLIDLYRKHGTYTGVARELGVTRNAAKYRFAKHHLIPGRPLQRG